MMTPIIDRVVFDVFERTVRWRSIINRMRVGGMECRRGPVRLCDLRLEGFTHQPPTPPFRPTKKSIFLTPFIILIINQN
jgi:hypothetical protein